MIIDFIVILIILSCLSAFFSAAETAFISVNKHILLAGKKNNVRAATLSLDLLENPTKLLGLVLLGNNLVNVAISALSTLIFVRFFESNAVFLVTIVVTIFILLFCETIPKSYAVRYSHKLVLVFSYVLYPMQIVATPVVNAINFFVVFIDKLLFNKKMKKNDGAEYGIERLRGAVSEARTILTKSHGDMLLGILDLDQVSVEEAMTSLGEVESINFDESVEKIIEDIKNAKHSHLIVYKKNLGDCLGFINVKRVLLLFNFGKVTHKRIKEVIDESEYIPNSVNLLNLMGKFIERKEKRAFVVDEYGTVQGIVTISDLMANIMGKMDSLLIEELSPGVFKANINVPVREINNRTGWNVQGGPALTIRGLIQERIEAIPEGDVCFSVDDYMFETNFGSDKDSKHSPAHVIIRVKRKPQRTNLSQ